MEMEKMHMILLGLLVMLIYTLYIQNRNHKVFSFRMWVLDLSDEYESKMIASGNPFNFHAHYKKLPSDNRMLFSFKKLKLETFFTNKEIKELLDGQNYKT